MSDPNFPENTKDPGTKIGVVVCNIGGPSAANERIVRAYLKNFFNDPAILPVRQPLRWMIARKIARRRAPESTKNYAKIGGRSPILDWTAKQARLLEELLARRADGRAYRCAVAMRYTPPFTNDALDALDRDGFRRIVALPVYPQESWASTGSALGEIDRVLADMNLDRGINFLEKVGEVRSFHGHPTYLAALAERVREGLARFPRPDAVHLFFSAHGLPQLSIDRGDPYQKQIEATVRALLALLALPNHHSLAYQNRVGPQKWIGPEAAVELQRLGKAGILEMLVIPVSFVSDHLETLHEIALHFGEVARRSGIERFECTTGLNDSPTFIRALGELVIGAIDGGAAAVAAARETRPLSRAEAGG